MTYEIDGLPLPPSSRRAAQRLAADEVASVYRHDLTGKLGAVRMLLYTLRRRLFGAAGAPAPALDARVAETIDLVESAVKGALGTVERSLLADTHGEHDPTDLAELVTELVGRAGVVRLSASAPSSAWVDADGDELAAALAALVDNALEASAGPVVVRCSADAARVRVEVEDGGPGPPPPSEDAQPFTSDKPGRIGLGLRIVRRVARRWQGSFELARRDGRTVATLELPRIRGAGG
ncbi:MAG TPA: ATP-binding protein [Minicystis sp.]|nr:ATP-binding protein [Minicystis sp.]